MTVSINPSTQQFLKATKDEYKHIKPEALHFRDQKKKKKMGRGSLSLLQLSTDMLAMMPTATLIIPKSLVYTTHLCTVHEVLLFVSYSEHTVFPFTFVCNCDTVNFSTAANRQRVHLYYHISPNSSVVKHQTAHWLAKSCWIVTRCI